MAVEQIRGCGYRKVNALYIVGEYISSPCDRLPLPLTTCPVCGGGIKVSRAFTEINPYRLWQPHDINDDDYECKDIVRPCWVCDPPDDVAFIMLVGEKYYKTPQDFMKEAREMGISKRIPFIPKGLELGETVLYLAHPKACEVREPVALQQAMSILEGEESKQPRLVEAEKVEKALGIFCAFIPKRVEKLVWESELTNEKREQLGKRGITSIAVPDGDLDHK